MDEREFVIILNDIHMGTSAPTVWYRKEIHEKYLASILDEIIIHADKIQEVVLIGDIFEFWAYPPDEIPPTIDDIISANPNILGPQGKLCQMLSALKGRVVFIPGDHDINVNEAELKKIQSIDGYTMRFHAGNYVPDYDSRILFTHGHEFTQLNAPYSESILAPLPLGYFVSRAFAHKIEKILYKMPGRTVANLEAYGAENVNDFISKLPDFPKCFVNSSDFINKFIDAISYTTGVPKDQQIPINQNTSLTLNDIKEIYKNYDRTCLPWQLQTKKLQGAIDTIVMGHTHTPVITFSNDMIHYINTGFLCPSVSNLRRNTITYGRYDLSNRQVQLMNPNLKLVGPPRTNAKMYEKTVTAAIQIKENNSVLNGSKKQYTFGWSVYNASWEYYRTMQEGVLSKAKELGIDVISEDQKSNAAEMITGGLRLISKNVNALLISPYNPEGVPVIVEAANKKQIPVVVIDGGTGGAEVAAFIVSDSFGGGILAGEYTLKLIKKYAVASHNAAIIKAEETAKYALLRGQGFKSVMVSQGYNIVAEVSANGNQAPAYEEMKKILTSYGNDLAVVFCENGLMTIGAAQAILEAGKKGKILIMGFDADSGVITGIKDGLIQGTIAQQPFKMGQLGVEIANSVLLGIPLVYDDWSKREILMEVYLINENGEIQSGIV